MRPLKLFGVELEGGWDMQPPDHRFYKEDGSVNVRGTWRVGEIVSEPLSRISEATDFIERNYPQHVGGSCGLHVHMSFRNNEHAISILSDGPEYHDTLLQHLREIGRKLNIRNQHFWHRLDNQNQFCRTEFTPDGVLGHARYRAVNFTAYQRHKTVEVRILPMFQSPKLAQKFVRRVLSFTNRFICEKLAESDFFELAPEIQPAPDLSQTEQYLINREILV